MRPKKAKDLNIDRIELFKPRKWQRTALSKRRRYSVWMIHRRAGKTVMSVAVLVDGALNNPNANFVYLAPYKTQARRVAWKVLKNHVKPLADLGQVEIYESSLTIRFKNGSEIYLLGADNPDDIRGDKLKGVVVDEVAQMPSNIWTSILFPALQDSKGWAIFIGTPNGTNLLSELFYFAQKKEEEDKEKSLWTSLTYDLYHTDAFNEQERKEIEEQYVNSPNEFAREWMCSLDVASENQLISAVDIRLAMNNKLNKEAYQYATVIMGVDVARYGTDQTKIAIRQGRYVYPFITLEKTSVIQTARKIVEIYQIFKPKAIYIDGTGVGGGVVDAVRSMGLQVFDINFSQKADKAEYANKRSELWGEMSVWLTCDCQLPYDENLIVDLSSPLYTKDDGQKLKLESKKDTKKRIGRSTDSGDALALTFSGYVSEVETRSEMEFFDDFEETQIIREHDPYERYKQERQGSFTRNFYNAMSRREHLFR